MYILSSKKDIVLTVLFSIMMAAIIFLWRSKVSVSEKLRWALIDIQMANDKTDMISSDLKIEKLQHAYTSERLELEKSMRSLEKEAVAAAKRLNAKENK